MRDFAAEILGDGLAHVSESVADAEFDIAAAARRKAEDGYVLARVIRRGREGIGIATVVCGNHQQIGFDQLREEWAEK